MARAFVLLFLGWSGLFAQETVVLLHGLSRTSKSMDEMAVFLQSKDFSVLNIDYLSRSRSI
jgi:alpha-beta hydrolase superfamily lysophospholipase